MLTGFLVLAALAGSTQQSSNPVHYRVTLKSDRHIDSTAAGEEARGGAYSVVAYMTATMTSDASQRMGHVIVDSVRCSGTGLMSMAFDSVVGPRSRGTRFDFPIGARSSVIPTPSISNSLTNTLAQTALMLFPTMAADLQVGVTWADSLDTSPMSDVPAKSRPIVTRWKVTAAGADTVAAEGDVRGSLTFSGRVLSTGLITGTRHIAVSGGVLRWQSSTTRQETLMVGDGASTVTAGSGTTTVQIVVVQ